MKDLERVKAGLIDDHNHICDQLKRAYQELADVTARYAQSAKDTGYFTSPGHLDMYINSIKDLTTRMNTCNEKLMLVNWIKGE